MSNNENSSLSMEKYNLVAFYNFLAHLFKTKAMIDAGVLKFFCNAIMPQTVGNNSPLVLGNAGDKLNQGAHIEQIILFGISHA